MLEFVLLNMLLGSAAGLLAGLFGLGGGVIIVPSLLWLFSAQQFPMELQLTMAIATSLATIILTSISSAISHHKLGNILWNKVRYLTPGILFGAAIGAVSADLIETELLKLIFISYLLFVGIRMAFKKQAISSKKAIENGNKWLDYLTGNGIGFLSSLLGIGGGTLTVPYLVNRQIPMKKAIGVSSVCGIPIAVSGSLTYAILGWDKIALPEWSLGYIYLPALFGISICSIVTAPLGAKLANHLPTKTLKRYFSIVLFLIATKMIGSMMN